MIGIVETKLVFSLRFLIFLIGLGANLAYGFIPPKTLAALADKGDWKVRNVDICHFHSNSF